MTSPPERTARRTPVLLGAIVCLGLFLRLSYLAHATARPGYRLDDPDSYLRQGERIALGASGWWFDFDVVEHAVEGRRYALPPLYPVFLSLFALLPGFPRQLADRAGGARRSRMRLRLRSREGDPLGSRRPRRRRLLRALVSERHRRLVDDAGSRLHSAAPLRVRRSPPRAGVRRLRARGSPLRPRGAHALHAPLLRAGGGRPSDSTPWVASGIRPRFRAGSGLRCPDPPLQHRALAPPGERDFHREPRRASHRHRARSRERAASGSDRDRGDAPA